MIERIAAAIRKAEIEGKAWERDQVAPYPEFDALMPSEKRRYVQMATAALAAMRGPTPQMINAALAWQAHCSDVDSLFEEMVMAALHPEDYSAELPALYA